RVTALQAPAASSDPIVVTGDDMNRVLDVVIGDRALSSGTYSAVRGGFVGFTPELPPGTYPVRVRGQNCSDVDTGLTYTIP
ncbi:MAG TPA: hypothetical protein VGD87_13480, partial [Archangium sp.]